jgi:hypothetical protein
VRETPDDAVMTFDTTHQAMAAEDILREAGFQLEVVPPPRGLTAGCGLALRLDLSDIPAATQVLRRRSASWAAVHRLSPDGKVEPIAPTRFETGGQ